MKKIISFILMSSLLLTISVGCSNKSNSEKEQESKEEVKIDKGLQIRVQGDDDQTVEFQLNDSLAAKSFYDQLPLTIDVENYRGNEKIIYPPKKLNVTDTPLAKGPIGTLAYYEPWGDVVMYYGECNGAEGLYALGDVISGVDQISKLTGTIKITKISDTSKQIESKTKEGMGQKEKEKADPVNENEQPITNPPVVSENHNNQSSEVNTMHSIQITVSNQIFTASLYDNETVRSLLDRLPMTIQMDELHGNEKYYYFSDGLPSNPQSVSQIYTGDIKLFGSDCLVFFYKDFPTSFTYTSLGQIDDPKGFMNSLGSGSVTVQIENLN